MTRKRRVFDIDLPEDDIPTPAPQQAQRRGPMASAISENAEALQARKDAAQAIREENDALAHAFVAARDGGHVVEHIPLDQIKTTLLVRDRMPGEDMELAELISSLRDVGLSNPIRVSPTVGGFELVQGFRRLQAFRALLKETGDQAWAVIPALLMDQGQGVDGLYRRMIDENVIRKDLSFAEMAEAARNFAVDPATPADSVDDAVPLLFKSASYTKRSYIRSFARLLHRLDGLLHYPNELPRNLGLALLKEIEAKPVLIDQIRAALSGWDDRSIADELNVLRKAASADALIDGAPDLPRGEGAAKGKGAGDQGKTKTTFDLRTARGRVKCTAAVGRLEIKTDRDFSKMDRVTLEKAIASLMEGLG